MLKGVASFPVRVDCYAGHRGEQEPRKIFPFDRPVRVRQILDRWLAPDHRYFKVEADDGGIYLLRHGSAAEGDWEITFYREP